MSMLFLTVAALFCASFCQAALPPRDVYSASIVNQRGEPVNCVVYWSKLEKQSLQNQQFRLENSETFLVPEKTVSMGTWEARAAIEKIQCGTLILRAPFADVDGPKTNWKFIVNRNEILSVKS